ncbi:MAG: hypothetical protein P4L99_23410 [Chthoniobacter sp.]|nr:hypothetical protein [Chthoniobacter sp.]
MTSFVKYIAVCAAALVATAAGAEKNGDSSTPKPDGKDTGTPAKKAKKPKTARSATEDTNAPKKMDVPVVEGHPSKGLRIPYYDSTGKHDMQFNIGVATRLDDNHVAFTDLQIETFNEQGEHEMSINMPTSVMNTDTSVITTEHHVDIRRADFDLTGETMIFNTRTKQGGLGGHVHMTIYNLDDETGENRNGTKPAGAKAAKTGLEPDSFKTPPARSGDSVSATADKADKFVTPAPK